MNLDQELMQIIAMMTTSVWIVLLLEGIDGLLGSRTMITHNLKMHISVVHISIFK